MSYRIPSLPPRPRTAKVLTNRGRLIETILRIHNDQGRQRRRDLEGKLDIAPRIGPQDGATGA